MQFKTHFAMTLFSVLFLIEHTHYKIAFFIVALIAGVMPDLGSGTKGGLRFLRFLGQGGLLHSLTFCILITIILAAYFPIYALPFFLGYSLHLFADSFTVEGIRPFWPLHYESKGPLKQGSSFESALFIGFCIVDFVLVINFFI